MNPSFETVPTAASRSRSHARRGAVLLTLVVLGALGAPGIARGGDAIVSRDLLRDAQDHPNESFSVIVQGDGTKSSAGLAKLVVDAIVAEAEAALAKAEDDLHHAGEAAAHAEKEQAEAVEALANAQAKLERVRREAAAAAGKAAITGKDSDRRKAASAALKIDKAVLGVQRAQAHLVAAEQGLVDAVHALAAAEQRAEEMRGKLEEARSRAFRDQIGERFTSIAGVAATLLGEDLVELAKKNGIHAITENLPIALSPGSGASLSADPDASSMWRESTGLDALWRGFAAPRPPAIAIVDSGVDASRVEDFGGRVIASVNLSSGSPNATGDDEGHGTMVAGIAAGSSPLFPGAAPSAPIVDVRTADGQGMSQTSDVIAAVDWILRNRDRYGIRVANFSLAGTSEASFRFDPLDRAVEKLWLSGVVVVAAMGNHGSAGGPVKIPAPANDPFIISVGALDQAGTPDPGDDFCAPWSAFGHTADGFSKPELSAPGRYLVGPVSANSLLARTRADRLVAEGYMWMSGTSFAAPIVSGAAAQLLALHPNWTPDDVKGALMLTATALPSEGFAAGVGELDAEAASEVSQPPNPNAALLPFVLPATSADATPVFDAASWSSAAKSSASWSSASWSSASWSSASWSSASWSSASWSSASWSSASWSSASWSSASWSSAADVE